MSAVTSRISNLTIVYSTIYSRSDQRKHQSSASRAFVRGSHRWLVNTPHQGPVTWKMFPFDDVIVENISLWRQLYVPNCLAYGLEYDNTSIYPLRHFTVQHCIGPVFEWLLCIIWVSFRTAIHSLQGCRIPSPVTAKITWRMWVTFWVPGHNNTIVSNWYPYVV